MTTTLVALPPSILCLITAYLPFHHALKLNLAGSKPLDRLLTALGGLKEIQVVSKASFAAFSSCLSSQIRFPQLTVLSISIDTALAPPPGWYVDLPPSLTELSCKSMDALEIWLRPINEELDDDYPKHCCSMNGFVPMALRDILPNLRTLLLVSSKSQRWILPAVHYFILRLPPSLTSLQLQWDVYNHATSRTAPWMTLPLNGLPNLKNLQLSVPLRLSLSMHTFLIPPASDSDVSEQNLLDSNNHELIVSRTTLPLDSLASLALRELAMDSTFRLLRHFHALEDLTIKVKDRTNDVASLQLPASLTRLDLVIPAKYEEIVTPLLPSLPLLTSFNLRVLQPTTHPIKAYMLVEYLPPKLTSIIISIWPNSRSIVRFNLANGWPTSLTRIGGKFTLVTHENDGPLPSLRELALITCSDFSSFVFPSTLTRLTLTNAADLPHIALMTLPSSLTYLSLKLILELQDVGLFADWSEKDWTSHSVLRFLQAKLVPHLPPDAVHMNIVPSYSFIHSLVGNPKLFEGMEVYDSRDLTQPQPCRFLALPSSLKTLHLDGDLSSVRVADLPQQLVTLTVDGYLTLVDDPEQFDEEVDKDDSDLVFYEPQAASTVPSESPPLMLLPNTLTSLSVTTFKTYAQRPARLWARILQHLPTLQALQFTDLHEKLAKRVLGGLPVSITSLKLAFDIISCREHATSRILLRLPGSWLPNLRVLHLERAWLSWHTIADRVHSFQDFRVSHIFVHAHLLPPFASSPKPQSLDSTALLRHITQHLIPTRFHTGLIKRCQVEWNAFSAAKLPRSLTNLTLECDAAIVNAAEPTDADFGATYLAQPGLDSSVAGPFVSRYAIDAFLPPALTRLDLNGWRHDLLYLSHAQQCSQLKYMTIRGELRSESFRFFCAHLPLSLTHITVHLESRLELPAMVDNFARLQLRSLTIYGVLDLDEERSEYDMKRLNKLPATLTHLNLKIGFNEVTLDSLSALPQSLVKLEMDEHIAKWTVGQSPAEKRIAMEMVRQRLPHLLFLSASSTVVSLLPCPVVHSPQ